MIRTFDTTTFPLLCRQLGKKDTDLQHIIDQYGLPPLWNRKPSFETLIHIILEQQVSLASAKAALDQLKRRIGRITPGKILSLTDDEMKACYFSRQKTIYAKHLAKKVLTKQFSISQLKTMDDKAVRTAMKQLKGIGDWTADVFLMMALQRSDCFPTGDIALINSIKKVKKLPPDTTKETILEIAAQWQPNRTIAAYLLWHHYLGERKKKS